jgi:hypothetical protein
MVLHEASVGKAAIVPSEKVIKMEAMKPAGPPPFVAMTAKTFVALYLSPAVYT